MEDRIYSSGRRVYFEFGQSRSCKFEYALGAVVAIFEFWSYQRKWQRFVSGIIGLRLILLSVVAALTDQVNLILSGIAVAALAILRNRQHSSGGRPK